MRLKILVYKNRGWKDFALILCKGVSGKTYLALRFYHLRPYRISIGEK